MAKAVSAIMRFALQMQRNEDPSEVFGRFNPGGRYALNRTQWRGKEPRSCAVTDMTGTTSSPGNLICQIEVSYRPKGFLSYVGNTRFDGWTAMVLNRETDPPTYVPREVFGELEFNELDFGSFLGEVDVGAVSHATTKAVRDELMAAGGKISGGILGSFMALHRYRPHKKIMLSNSPSSTSVDGFGTHIININRSTPNLKLVVAEQIISLVYEFLEGKTGLNSWGNDRVSLLKLSDILVDCTPNERSEPTLFNVLHEYVPPDFMEDLAKRLMSIYAVEVSFADDEPGTLIIRWQEKTK